MAKRSRPRGNSNSHQARSGTSEQRDSAIAPGNKHRRVGWPTCGHKDDGPKGKWEVPGDDGDGR